MWKLFESDRVTMFLCILGLIFTGVFVRELFLSSFDLSALLAMGANFFTICAALFAFWAYAKWKISANNDAKHKLVLDFIIQLQSLDLVIYRLLRPSSKEQFIADYECWSNMYLALIHFRKRFCILTNQVQPTFIELNLPHMALLEGHFSRIRVIHTHACNDFDIPYTEGAGLLYEFLKGNVQKEGRYNQFHAAWTKDITYQNLSFSDVIGEIQALLHH
ncbi:MAG: hypothetical protein ACI808_002987 [Paraglaciecola sp.]|jgi:hypothetical protein